MNLDMLSALVSLLLAISLASERGITIVKTLFPRLADERKTPAQEVDLEGDKWRRLVVLVLAFVFSWVAAALLADGGKLDLTGVVSLGVASASLKIPVVLLGVLGSGGSALWNNVLGFTKAAKDTRQVLKAAETLEFHRQASAAGVVAFDSGQVARMSRRGNRPIDDARVRRGIAARTQPKFDEPTANLLTAGGNS